MAKGPGLVRRLGGLAVGLAGCGVVVVGALIYGFFLLSVYEPILPASEACANARGGVGRDYGGEPTTTPGVFPISSVCLWPETGEELELVSRDVTVLPLVVMGIGVVTVAAGGVVFWGRSGGR
ncbi:hypothetical protein GCM10009554_24410 [Kribbella koreensis]|uniref:Uncharacterized protein n=1 Tax=Kribbella koreensis TaxID=57909 RepID=A0ABN1Q3C3_9ACTN